MFKKITLQSKLIYAQGLTLLLLMPVLTFAQGPRGINFELNSPLGFETVEELLLIILNAFIIIATPLIVLYIIYAGFLYVTARGNAEQTKKATTAITYAIIGGVIMLGATALAEILTNIVNAFRAE